MKGGGVSQAAEEAEQNVNCSGWFRDGLGWDGGGAGGKESGGRCVRHTQLPSKKRTRCWYGCRNKRKWPTK
jgi:hypothetical protein